LSSEIEADAVAVKKRADDLQEVLTVYWRERVVERYHALIGAMGVRVEPGLVAWSKLDGVATAAEEVLMGDGEVVPKPRRDPRVPRAGMRIPDADEAWT
jgi:hypothetical protein